jgi:hypothetical protein
MLRSPSVESSSIGSGEAAVFRFQCSLQTIFHKAVLQALDWTFGNAKSIGHLHHFPTISAMRPEVAQQEGWRIYKRVGVVFSRTGHGLESLTLLVSPSNPVARFHPITSHKTTKPPPSSDVLLPARKE